MNKFQVALSILALIMFSCSNVNKLKESRLETERSANPEFLEGNLFDVDTFNLEIIPPSSGVQFFRDGIMFLASSKNEENMLHDHLSFGTIKSYYAGIYEGTLFKYTDFSPTFPFTFPSDATTFSSDFKTMYFTGISKTDNKEKIYEATHSAGDDYQTGWDVKEAPVSFCQENMVYTHPALSVDGSMMIFASDKKGSTGGLDLYITHNKGNGWSDPENMSSTINSSGNELFPFLDSDNNLFFSSDRTGGKGGYDIYVSWFNGKTWNQPEILTSRINTTADDISFRIDRKDGKSAFYTTRDKSGNRHTQLFRITVNENIAANKTKNLSQIMLGMSPTLAKGMIASAEKKDSEPVIQQKAEIKSEIKSETKAETKAEVKPEVKTEVKTETKAETKPSTDVASKPSTSTSEKTVSADKKGTVIYRVQIITTSISKGSYPISINSKNYQTWEYLYKGAYRTTVGEFKTLSEATVFQNTCRKSGYPQAFVVVFVDDIRSTDPKFF